FQKVREEMILTKLDARPKKIPPPVEVPATGPGAPLGGGPGRPPGAPGGPGRPPAMARKMQ
ncbi:MAG: chemotaxis response regulator protein-glutamate methylesterase, partial [Bryobacteraceae bacterium]